MRLSAFLVQHREQILGAWVTFAQTAAPCAAQMDIAALRDHASEMLDAIVVDLNTPQDRGQESEKSRGRSDAAAAERAAPTAAQAHGAGRARSGFDVQQMIAEYRALRASVLRLWLDSPGFPPDANEDVMRFNEAVDQALAESTASYSRVVEQTLRDAREQLEIRVDQRTKELARANESLRTQIHERERAEEVRIRLLQHLVKAQENEQRRISRELHDQLGQQVTALGVKLATLKNRAEVTPHLQKELASLGSIVRQLDQDVDFIVWQLRPTALDDLGLAEALDAYVTNWSRHFDVAVDFRTTGLQEARVAAEIETVLYRMTQEALNNVAKHARAQHVEVVLQHGPDETVLTVADDGVGFDVQPQHGERTGSAGLNGMRERAALVGGTMTVEAKLGGGTTVLVRVPVRPHLS